MKHFCLLIFFFHTLPALAQTQTLKGIVKNTDGEPLPMATVLLLPDSAISTSDNAGRFAVTSSNGIRRVIISYTGYDVLDSEIELRSDTLIHFTMVSGVSHLREIVVDGSRFSSEDLVHSSRTGTTTLTGEDISGIPVLGGEADLIKTLQLLPGTVRGVEGSSDLFVRGGAADQNLVLLDGAPIYNTSHLFGFLSVFNPAVLDHVEAINGGFPAELGGRLSSILNVTSHDHVADNTKGSGNIGLIASTLYLEQPLVQDKASFWIAGRRTYIDQLLKVVGQELPYFFYDLNGKVVVAPSEKDKLEFSFYTGEDVLDVFRDRNDDGNGYLTSYTSGNASQSFRWRHQMPQQWTATLSLIRSKYDYHISNAFQDNELMAMSDVEDYGARIVFRKDSLSRNGSVQFGAEWTRHGISPSVVNTTGTIAELLESSASKGKVAHELAAHVEREVSITPRLLLNAGLRGSAGMANATLYVIPEPRVSIRYSVSDQEAVKASYSRMAQYVHRISNSAVTAPTDVWYTITNDVAPQTSHQVAVAWQRFGPARKVFFSAEAYYKTMRNLIGFEEGTNLFFNTDFESRLIQGNGRAYGLEFLTRKEAGKFTGWVTYTLSWSHRQFDEIEGATWFPARYDRRHNGAIVMQYTFSKRWAASLVWEYMSGARFTPVVGQYVMLSPTLTGVDLIPLYSEINGVKLKDSHRLDAGLKFKSKPEKKIQWHLFAGVYNVYNRASPVGMIIEQNEADGSLKYLQPGLFGMLPFISYGFTF